MVLLFYLEFICATPFNFCWSWMNSSNMISVIWRFLCNSVQPVYEIRWRTTLFTNHSAPSLININEGRHEWHSIERLDLTRLHKNITRVLSLITSCAFGQNSSSFKLSSVFLFPILNYFYDWSISHYFKYILIHHKRSNTFA